MSAKARRIRRPGFPWRFLGHEYVGGKGPCYGDSLRLSSDDHPRVEFDELVVGTWLHVEQMNSTQWWMSIGGVTVWVTADRDGAPTQVQVYGPDDYEGERPGVAYGCTWNGDRVEEIP